MTAPTRVSVTSALPTSSSGHGRNWRTLCGTPASQRQRASHQPTSTASGAGFRMTVLPAASAASVPPAGMERGKFQGGVTTTTPRGAMAQSASSAVISTSARA